MKTFILLILFSSSIFALEVPDKCSKNNGKGPWWYSDSQKNTCELLTFQGIRDCSPKRNDVKEILSQARAKIRIKIDYTNKDSVKVGENFFPSNFELMLANPSETISCADNGVEVPECSLSVTRKSGVTETILLEGLSYCITKMLIKTPASSNNPRSEDSRILQGLKLLNLEPSSLGQ